MNSDVISELKETENEAPSTEGVFKMANIFDKINGKIQLGRKVLFQKGKLKKCPVSIKFEYDPFNKGETYVRILF